MISIVRLGRAAAAVYSTSSSSSNSNRLEVVAKFTMITICYNHSTILLAVAVVAGLKSSNIAS